MTLIKDPVGARRLTVSTVPLPVHTADEAAEQLAAFSSVIHVHLF